MRDLVISIFLFCICSDVIGQDEIINGNLEVKGGAKLYSTETGKTSARLTLNTQDADNAYIYNYNESTKKHKTLNLGGTAALKNGVTILENGDVGIGVADPRKRFHIKGVNNFSQAIIEGGSNAGLQFKSSGATLRPVLTGNEDKFSIQTWKSDHEWKSTSLTVLNNGNIGIGTLDPTVKLEVNGVFKSNSIESKSTIKLYSTESGKTSARLTLNTLDADNAYIYNYNESTKKYKTLNLGGTAALKNGVTILENGDVGIGVADPRKRFHIKGVNNFSQAIIEGGSNAGLQFKSSGATLRPVLTGNEDKFSIQTWKSDHEWKSTSLTVLNNGNVGIGTLDPDSKLTVAGNIHSREVKVTVDAGADFVFLENYELPKLEEVEDFVNKNKHLPEIAPARAMERDGIELAQMNIKLLQKIEELTLYTILQQKEINILQKENKLLKELSKKLDLLNREVQELKGK